MARTAEASPLMVRTEERAALAEAIAKAATATRTAEAARAAVDRARAALWTAQTVFATATEAVATARQNQVERITSAAATDVPDLSVREARRAEIDASDDVEIARDVLARVEAALLEPEYAERKAAQALEASADAVIASHAHAALDAAQEAEKAFARRHMTLRQILRCMHFDPAGGGFAREVSGYVDVHPASWPVSSSDLNQSLDAELKRIAAPWTVARAALLTDADASLPAVT